MIAAKTRFDKVQTCILDTGETRHFDWTRGRSYSIVSSKIVRLSRPSFVFTDPYNTVSRQHDEVRFTVTETRASRHVMITARAASAESFFRVSAIDRAHMQVVLDAFRIQFQHKSPSVSYSAFMKQCDVDKNKIF